MSRVIVFSRVFPAYHPRKGEPTFFVEKIWKGLDTGNRLDGEYSVWTNKPRQMKDGHWQLPHLWRDLMNDKNFIPKGHTIRAGNRWKVGDKFSPRVWSGKPYRSKQIVIAPDIEIKKVWSFLGEGELFYLDGEQVDVTSCDIPMNDGLSSDYFLEWFPCDKYFEGQIICWNENINY